MTKAKLKVIEVIKPEPLEMAKDVIAKEITRFRNKQISQGSLLDTDIRAIKLLVETLTIIKTDDRQSAKAAQLDNLSTEELEKLFKDIMKGKNESTPAD